MRKVKKAVMGLGTFRGRTDLTFRETLLKSLTPIQYLRLQDTSGTTAADLSGSNRNGTYNATSVPNMLAKVDGPFGGKAPQFSSANLSYIDGYSASLGAAASGTEGAAFVCVKMDPAAWTDGAQHYFWHMRASATYYLALQKWTTNDQVRLRRFTNATDLSVSFLINSPLWFTIGMDWSESGGWVRLFVNGRQQGADGTISVAWTGAITAERIGRDISTSLFHSGGLAEFALFNHPIGAAAHLALAGMYADRNIFLGYGDSKTASNVYQHTTAGLLESNGNRWDWRNIAVSGRTVATNKATIDADLAATDYTPRYVLSNMGANDVAAMPTEANFKADYQYILNAMKSKWPGVKIYIMRPWRRTYNTNCNTLATWIGDLVTANPGVCFLGPDERVFIENGDDGATYSTDGIHPTTAGYALVGQQWASILPA